MRDRDRYGVHLILVGLPGAGKTTVGRLVAQQLGSPFIDIDEEIESRAGATISSIFAAGGEPAFRDLEREATVDIRPRVNSVVAPGGGWIGNPAAVALLRPPGRIIHLRVSPATALARMGATVDARPLLRGADPVSTLARLALARADAYASADTALDTETLSLQELVQRVAVLATVWDAGVG